jgi:hypothetical protein
MRRGSQGEERILSPIEHARYEDPNRWDVLRLD